RSEEIGPEAARSKQSLAEVTLQGVSGRQRRLGTFHTLVTRSDKRELNGFSRTARLCRFDCRDRRAGRQSLGRAALLPEAPSRARKSEEKESNSPRANVAPRFERREWSSK